MKKLGICIIIAVTALCLVCTGCSTAQKISLTKIPGENRVEVLVDGREFTSYWWHPTILKPVLYPVRTAKGTTLTRNYPPMPNETDDHPHHVGIWFNYGNVNGLDFWNNSGAISAARKPDFGAIKHREIKTMQGGKEGGLVVVSDWVDNDGKVLLEEETTYTFKAKGDLRIIDRQAKLTARTDVEFKDNKEGCIAIRVTTPLQLPSSIKKKTFTDEHGVKTEVVASAGANANYLSSEGIEGDAVWGTRAKWVKLHGKFEDENADVVIIDHPENPGYPTYWHARGYGLFAANTLGQKVFSKGKLELDFKLAQGAVANFKYRILVNCGKTLSEGKIEAQFVDFAE